jgi:hypothetical protein
VRSGLDEDGLCWVRPTQVWFPQWSDLAATFGRAQPAVRVLRRGRCLRQPRALLELDMRWFVRSLVRHREDVRFDDAVAQRDLNSVFGPFCVEEPVDDHWSPLAGPRE